MTVIAAASNQFQFTTAPLFAPAHGSSNTNTTSAENLAAFFSNGNGQHTEDYALDLELLAEYLLDDNHDNTHCGQQDQWVSATPPMIHDVGNSTRAPAQLATPEYETDQVFTADGRVLMPVGGAIAEDIAQVQQMIAQHAARAQAAVEAQRVALSFPPATVVAVPEVAKSNLTTSMTTSTGIVCPQAVATSVAKRPAPTALDVLSSSIGGASRRRPKSEAQVSRRRERNRVLARRTRLRKKFFFEGLQKEVMDLQREHNALKDIVRRNLEQSVADEILKDANIELPSVVLENCDTDDVNNDLLLDHRDSSFVSSLQSSQQCFIITDPSLHDNPVVYASEGFLTLTKYAKEEILGRNCRFLQGPKTNPDKVQMIRKACSAGEDVSVCIANYTADGEAFWNQLFIAALRDVEDNIVNFVGVLVRVPRPGPDDPEHNKILVDVPLYASQENADK